MLYKFRLRYQVDDVYVVALYHTQVLTYRTRIITVDCVELLSDAIVLGLNDSMCFNIHCTKKNCR